MGSKGGIDYPLVQRWRGIFHIHILDGMGNPSAQYLDVRPSSLLGSRHPYRDEYSGLFPPVNMCSLVFEATQAAISSDRPDDTSQRSTTCITGIT